ncbi:hypothetical protein NQ315_003700 [Exocentrus adspersus]|uniref:DUF5641 domain-containing protein n=1 Tax=Exocentrus adspersus TaxID=1586481 RepID=A0AAV8V6T9_9CUCU|nr:hypothetical protein NQ315_003700 [Exocentrus adspersus]
MLPGKDGRIRLVRVKTAKGQLLRPIQRLHPLECQAAVEVDSVVENTLEDNVIGETDASTPTKSFSSNPCDENIENLQQKFWTNRRKPQTAGSSFVGTTRQT